MKKAVTKLIAVALAVIVIAAGVGMGVPASKSVEASSKVSVKVSTTRKVKTKKYKLKKKVRRKKTTTKKKVKTTKKLTKSVSKKVEKVIRQNTVVKTTMKAKRKTVKTTITTKTTTKTTNLATSGSADINQLKGIIDTRVINSFKKTGMTIETNPRSSVLKGADGVFSPSRKRIYLKANVDRVLVHEVGHFVAYRQGRADSTKEFQAIYKAEKNKFKGDNKKYAVSSNKEFFAECFKEYSMNKSSLKKNCPRSYKYIESVISRM